MGLQSNVMVIRRIESAIFESLGIDMTGGYVQEGWVKRYQTDDGNERAYARWVGIASENCKIEPFRGQGK